MGLSAHLFPSGSFPFGVSLHLALPVASLTSPVLLLFTHLTLLGHYRVLPL